MMRNQTASVSILLVAGALALDASVSAAAPPSRPATTAKAATAASLQVVADPSTVCMMNDRVMGHPQIPVVVEGKTYYGCCAMCKDRLNQDAAARTATDPVTGKSVDKAKAVIAQRPDGSVLYFESKATLRRYRAASATEPRGPKPRS
jgi:YHS domain-containing protein